MKIFISLIAIIASLFSALIFQYGFNNLVADIIDSRSISFFESFVFVEFLAFISFLGNSKNFKREEIEFEEAVYNIFYKMMGYLVFIVIFVILTLIK